MRLHGTLLKAAFAAVLLASTTACQAKEQHTVPISYVVAPARPLPEGLKAVAVLDSGVQTQGAQEDEREAKWSTIAADMIEAMVQNGSRQFGAGLSVAKRRETRRLLTEQDLRLSGLVDAPTAARAGKLLDVQGLIVSRITVRMDIRKGTKSTVDWVSLLGQVASSMHEARSARRPPPAYPPPPAPRGNPARPPSPRPRDPRNPRYRNDPSRVYAPTYERRYRDESSRVLGNIQLRTKDVEEIARSLTVQCSFSLIDVTTGEALVQYSPPPLQKTDRKTPHFLFGSNMDEADLDPVDLFIGELVERSTQEFVGMIVPVPVEVSCRVEGRGKEGEAAVRAMRADDFAGAVRLFQAALASKPDEHRHVYALGVAYEAMGDRANALACYRRAASIKNVGKEDLAVYLAAKERLTQHIDRIVDPNAKPPPATTASMPADGPASAPVPIDPPAAAPPPMPATRPAAWRFAPPP